MTSNWSETNKKLVEKLELQGLMTDHGRAKVEAAKRNGCWDAAKSEPLTDEQLRQFEEMLNPYGVAGENFMRMPKSARTAYASSYFFTKTDDGRRKRLETIVERLNLNLNPMESMNSTFALSGLERGCLGSAARPVRPSGRVGRRCVPVKGVGFLQLGRLEWT